MSRYSRGRLPAQPLALENVHDYAIAPLPAPQYPVDVSGGITDWQMLGNGPDPTCTVAPDGVGNCTFAGREHYEMAKAAKAKKTETWETSNALVQEYLAYDDGQDNGAVISDLLLSWYKAGKILAFAPVDHTDPLAVDSAMALFSGVYVGVTLTDDAEDLFSQGQPWSVADGQQPDPNDGHCILKVRADGKGLDGYVTWGAGQPAETGWSAVCVDEAWVIITQEDEGTKLIDVDKLIAAIEALHGTAPSGPPAPAS